MLAIRELEGQKQRIETYEVQARYELAAIYDRTSNGPANTAPKAPQAKPDDTLPPPKPDDAPPPAKPDDTPPQAKP